MIHRFTRVVNKKNQKKAVLPCNKEKPSPRRRLVFMYFNEPFPLFRHDLPGNPVDSGDDIYKL
jgi:hypothetical protein